jgi:hypothetical protein
VEGEVPARQIADETIDRGGEVLLLKTMDRGLIAIARLPDSKLAFWWLRDKRAAPVLEFHPKDLSFGMSDGACFHVWGVEDGESSLDVRDVAAARDGQLVITTFNGLGFKGELPILKDCDGSLRFEFSDKPNAISPWLQEMVLWHCAHE